VDHRHDHEHDDAYESAAELPTEAEARAAVETLLLGGVGATYRPAIIAPARFEVVVVAGTARRAREILGLPEPEPDAELVVDQLRRQRPQWLYIVGIFLVALVVIPLVAFYATFKLAGG
jgi:hypothetical protein